MSSILSSKSQPAVSMERLQQLAVSDTGFVFDPQTGQSFTVNRTGLIVIHLLKRGADVDKASMTLAQNCDVSYELANSSVESFILQLGRYL